MIIIGLKMAWEPKNCYQGVSRPWIIWSQKKLKKVIAVLLKSTIMNKLELRPSCSSCKSWRGQIHPKFLISNQFRAHYRNPKMTSNNFLLYINNSSQNTSWNLKSLNQPARHIQRSFHCTCNISATMSGITKWLGYTISSIHSCNWLKFEDLTPASLDSGEHQSL